MKNTSILALACAVTATGAFAGGIDRSGQSIAPIFEDGSYLEFSFGSVNPTVSGVQTGTYNDGTTVVPGLGQSSGNMVDSYTSVGAAYKTDISDKFSVALIFDQPFGADVNYSFADSPAPYAYVGSTASIDSNSLTAVLRYKINDRISVLGGVREVTSKGKVALSNGYTMKTTTETDWGYVIGAAYEIPDIALRAALTYNSEITHDFTTTENGVFDSPMETRLPQSVNLDFQTGIAADTLLMASVRWAEWTAFDISPTAYVASAGDALVDYDNDTISYSLGVGRRFNDKLSGSIMVGYEKSSGGYSGNLGPTDGYASLGLGLKYQITEQTAISGGVRYVWIGDAETENPTAPGTTFGEFTGNDATAFGIKISHSF
ncbi:OmpP1/FadL family transporter [Celeribacter baekdonensis]|uniref:OmpP1/FadL family transporter n=1 Tax=Celeribacter baekdonensis TaxID=875171 RepID=UPI003A94A01F